jgi:hypothetical protein
VLAPHGPFPEVIIVQMKSEIPPQAEFKARIAAA